MTPDRNPSPEKPTLKMLPLGGLGEFGKNSLVFECAHDLIVVDCGQKFPDDDMPGVDSVIPDFGYVLQNIDKLQALLLTHAHEDHIGAVPYFVRQVRDEHIPIYGSPLTLALIREKLREHGLEMAVRYCEIHDGQRVQLGAFDCEFFSMAHSIPQAMGLAIRTPLGLVIHTGDYRIDQGSVENEGLSRVLRAAQSEHVLLLMSDSTNVDREGHSPDEAGVRVALTQLIREAERTLIIASFSSSLHRVQTIMELAEQHGRRVAICGYSLERNFSIATELGLLRYDPSVLYTLQELSQLPPSKRLIITTGTQGEPLSALSRLALNSFKGYRIAEGDTVVLSSRIIPGNEKAIYRMINQFYRDGARVITERDARVHASGHAYRDEMRELLEGFRPTYFVPMHGEYRQLIKHRELAIDCGVDEGGVFVIENGTMLEFEDRGVHYSKTDWGGEVLVDGKMMDGVEEVVLRDRKHLSEDGMLTVILAIDRRSHEIIAGPDFVTRGFVVVDDSEALLNACKEVVKRTFEECGPQSQEDWEVVKVAVRKALRKFLRVETDRYPVILPVVVEV